MGNALGGGEVGNEAGRTKGEIRTSRIAFRFTLRLTHYAFRKEKGAPKRPLGLSGLLTGAYKDALSLGRSGMYSLLKPFSQL